MSPAKTILLLGRKNIVLADAKSKLSIPSLNILGGTGIEDVRAAFANESKPAHVFMGAGLDIETRLEIVREVFKLSDTTSVHLKEATSGPQGFLPFVKGVLEGLGYGREG